MKTLNDTKPSTRTGTDNSPEKKSNDDSSANPTRHPFEPNSTEATSNASISSAPKVPLGIVVICPEAARTIPSVDINIALARHARGDWGDVCREDWQENELSLRRGFRLLSVYNGPDGTPFWIITEADRSSTTILLPEEY